MKKVLITLICIATGFSAALNAQTKKTEKVKGAVITVKGGDTHDFGSVTKGPIVHYTFELSNTGNEPLIIKDVNPSCGCTNVDFDKQPILPGKKGHIQVGLRTAEQHSNFMKEVYIQSNAANAGPDGRYTLHIKGLAIENTDNKGAAPEKK